MTSIRARLAAATGPDRLLDLAIAQALVPDVIVWLATKDTPFPGAPSTYWKYTASIDAAVALINHVLPGWTWKCGTCAVSDDAWICPDFNDPVHGARLRAEIGDFAARSVWDEGFDVDRRPPGNVAIALLQALFMALEAKAALSKPGSQPTEELHA